MSPWVTCLWVLEVKVRWHSHELLCLGLFRELRQPHVRMLMSHTVIFYGMTYVLALE